MSKDDAVLRELQDADAMAAEASAILAGWMHDTLSSGKKRCILALSGGTTPVPAYALLAKRTDLDWSRVWLILADERHVEAADKESNQRMIRETLMVPAGIPEEHCIFPDTSLPLHECVDEYERRVLQLLSNDGIDVLTLGMGDDGHIASLFPPVTDEGVMRMGIVGTVTDRFAVRNRISMALPLLQRSHRRMLLLRGPEKREVFERCTSAPQDLKRWPLQPLLDEETAVLLCS